MRPAMSISPVRDRFSSMKRNGERELSFERYGVGAVIPGGSAAGIPTSRGHRTVRPATDGVALSAARDSFYRPCRSCDATHRHLRAPPARVPLREAIAREPGLSRQLTSCSIVTAGIEHLSWRALSLVSTTKAVEEPEAFGYHSPSKAMRAGDSRRMLQGNAIRVSVRADLSRNQACVL